MIQFAKMVSRPIALLVVSTLVMGPGLATAQCACQGDCNADGTVAVNELIIGVSIALGSSAVSTCLNLDQNLDGQVAIAELTKAVSQSLEGCPTASPPSTEAGSLSISIDTSALPSGPPIGSRLTGNLLNPAGGNCPPLTQAQIVYSVNRSCTRGSTCTTAVTNLAPGIWVHRVEVDALSGSANKQLERRQAVVLASPATSNPVSWKVFPTVLEVDLATNAVTSGCTSALDNCSLRGAVSAAAGAMAPVRIQFKAGLGATTLTGSPLVLSSSLNGLVIDGRDSNGHPSSELDFKQRRYPIRINQQDSGDSGEIHFGGSNISVIGLDFMRTVSGFADQNIVTFLAGSSACSVQNSRLDGGMSSSSLLIVGKDGVVNRSSSPGNNVIQSEIRNCGDRGVKSSGADVEIQDSWIHNNLQGGLFALDPTGRFNSVRNLIEHNGRNCPNSGTPYAGLSPGSIDPANCGAAITAPDASQLSTTAGDGSQRITTNSNVIRNGVARGIFIQGMGGGTLNSDFVCGINGSATGSGLVLDNSAGTLVTVLGGAFIKSANAGVLVKSGGFGFFGQNTPTNRGNNAFARNSSRNFINESGGQTAQDNQWQRCGNSDECNEGDVQNLDITGSLNIGVGQPHRNPPAFSLDPVSPTKVGRTGAGTSPVIVLEGQGFNGVEGASASSCNALVTTNRCQPNVTGTCVEFEVAPNDWRQAEEVLGVTPTRVMVRAPMACRKPINVRVRRLDANNMPVESNFRNFCVN